MLFPPNWRHVSCRTPSTLLGAARQLACGITAGTLRSDSRQFCVRRFCGLLLPGYNALSRRSGRRIRHGYLPGNHRPDQGP